MAEGEADYEKLPRRKREWLETLRAETHLPVIAPDGKSITEAEAPLSRRAEISSPQGTNEKTTGIISEKKKRRILKSFIGGRGRAQSGAVAGEEGSSHEGTVKGRPFLITRRPREIEEVDRTLSSLKSSDAVLTEILNTSQRILADPPSQFFRVEVLLTVADPNHYAKRFPSLRRLLQGREGAKQDLQLVSLVCLGGVLKDVLPGYKVIGDEALQKEGDETRLSQAVKKERLFESNLLRCYNALIRILNSRAAIYPLAVAAIVTALLHTSPSFNNSDALLKLCISMACSPPPESAEEATQCLLSLISADQRLEVARKVAAQVAQLIKRSGRRQARCGALLAALAELDFTAKECSARREADLRGLRREDLALLDSEARRQLLSATIYGPLEAFKSNKESIYRDLATSTLRILKEPSAFTDGTLAGGLKGLGRLADALDATLIPQVIAELRSLLQSGSALKSLPSDARLSAIETILKLEQRSEACEAPLSPVVGMDWLIDSFVEALQGLLASEPDAAAKSFPVKDIERIVQLLLKSSTVMTKGRLWSPDGAFSGMNQSDERKVTELVASLLGVALLLADAGDRLSLQRVIVDIVRRYPSLMADLNDNADDEEGPALPEGDLRTTLLWSLHLLKACVSTATKNLKNNAEALIATSCATSLEALLDKDDSAHLGVKSSV